MSDFILTRQFIKAGAYQGVLTARGRVAAEPVLELRLLDLSLGVVSVSPASNTANTWDVEAPIPSSALNDGVQTFVIRDAQSGDTLDSFAIIAGTPLEDDLRSEIALLRGELDMLKRAFRNHCAETRK